MQAVRSPDEIRDANTRYHDVAAASYDSKWGIDFGEVGQAQVLGKLRKLVGSELDTGYDRALGRVGREATCTDISPGMVSALCANASRLGLDVRTARADAEALPFADRSF